jgi:homogentisate 1,2-dioxygenase
MSNFAYLPGFGNTFTSESIPDSLPKNQNSPQKSPLNLYAEQLSGTSFTTPRCMNFRTWLYKLRPSISHQSLYRKINSKAFSNEFHQFETNPNQLRWKELPLVSEEFNIDFIDGITTVAGVGDPALKTGLGIYMYSCNRSMENKAFYSSDGDFLIVPQVGSLLIKTEMGRIHVEPLEIVVIPRGIKFAVYTTQPSRGYIAETFAGHFTLPDVGPIGPNGLAQVRDFLAPTAWFEDLNADFIVINKFSGELFEYSLPHSVFDTVAWHGNYYPYKYDLRKFNVIGSVLYDHPDPSIFTVLSCLSNEPGTAVLDFVIFPPRWIVAEHTFRPPFFHRNTMTEFMGNIQGTYDAKTHGFTPGTATLHSCMAAHGPESSVFEKASNAELAPVRFPDGTLQFMFETCYMLKVAPWSLERLDTGYLDCWQGLEKLFKSSS